MPPRLDKAKSDHRRRDRSINVHLGPDIKAQWTAYCKQLGKTPGAALKEAIEQQLQKVHGRPTAVPYRQVGEAPDHEPKVRVEILLTASEKAAVTGRAEAERCSQRHWIVSAIRAGLTHEPQFGMKEIEALGESNYQLLTIGRNLNQIARRLNEGHAEELTTQHVKALSQLIDKHTKMVSDALRASLERWLIE